MMMSRWRPSHGLHANRLAPENVRKLRVKLEESASLSWPNEILISLVVFVVSNQPV